MIILEETSTLGKNYLKKDLHKSFYCLVNNVPIEKTLLALRGLKEIPMNNFDLKGLLKINVDVSVENLTFIEESCGYGLNFFMKLQNDRDWRSMYNCVYSSKFRSKNQLNFLVDSREAFCDDIPLEIRGLIFKKIEGKKIFICSDCSETFTRVDALNRHENSSTRCVIGTELKPKSKVYGAVEDVPKSLFDAGFIDEEHLSFEQTDFGVFDIGKCLKLKA